ncbi:family 16 glycoside hydrolase [Bacteroidota bacterium]
MNKLFFILIALFFLSGCNNDVKENEWISLFDGESLDGWTPGEHDKSFFIEDGAIVSHGERSHLFYSGKVNDHDFKNFDFKCEVKVTPGSNSGLYFHTAFHDDGWPPQGYEVQINNVHNKLPDPPSIMTGSLNSVRNKYLTFVKDNEWFPIRMIVKGKRIQVWVNDKLVIDYQEPQVPFRPESNQGRVLSSGTFALQSHSPASKVFFRNIMVMGFSDDDTFKEPLPDVDEVFVKKITELHSIGFPLMDLHVHLKGGLSMNEALKHSRLFGMDYGVAVNCGVDFPIDTDEKLFDYIASVRQEPAFNAMQAEGREWVGIFSDDAVKTFDYVFTDAMTYTDPLTGKRVQSWKPEQVNIPDKQQFMEFLSNYIVQIMNEEPIDVYVNATYLPEVIANEYDELWTRERMERVIDAAVANDIAIEISARLKMPNFEFIKLAKEKGVKFTFGTNNIDNNLGHLEYCLQVLEECGLTPADMWVPKTKVD